MFEEIESDLLDYRLYVNDHGVVSCNEPNCQFDGELDLPGRRTTLRNVINAIEEHIVKSHGKESQ